jgi:transcription antitermination factor NusG
VPFIVVAGRCSSKEGSDTEGGEALTSAVLTSALSRRLIDCEIPAPWHVLWTRSHCEEKVALDLEARGFHPFLPLLQIWSRRRGLRHLIQVPMFPGYLFLHDPLDKRSHVEVRKARGLVKVLGDSWERPAVVPEPEVASIRRLVGSRLPALAHPFLKEGRRVRIVEGPLMGIEGLLAEMRTGRGLLVLSVELLQRSVAVEVDCTMVEPI